MTTDGMNNNEAPVEAQPTLGPEAGPIDTRQRAVCQGCGNRRWVDCDLYERLAGRPGLMLPCTNCRYHGGSTCTCIMSTPSMNDLLYKQAKGNNSGCLKDPVARLDRPMNDALVDPNWQGIPNGPPPALSSAVKNSPFDALSPPAILPARRNRRPQGYPQQQQQPQQSAGMPSMNSFRAQFPNGHAQFGRGVSGVVPGMSMGMDLTGMYWQKQEFPRSVEFGAQQTNMPQFQFLPSQSQQMQQQRYGQHQQQYEQQRGSSRTPNTSRQMSIPVREVQGPPSSRPRLAPYSRMEDPAALQTPQFAPEHPPEPRNPRDSVMGGVEQSRNTRKRPLDEAQQSLESSMETGNFDPMVVTTVTDILGNGFGEGPIPESEYNHSVSIDGRGNLDGVHDDYESSGDEHDGRQ
ncbi:unnamed protein product [Zymoseptoria tritici ST99CH_1E4]|uniref:Uncharacterized protein n=1 Tax=Zymoseptoria tritici ST99CH_1E4 TaxID=1276532 RepID=A0A2H1FJX0_ZYMTR|nr:unnamed protein product [Zymoseptoria tritici ST99CH_1E4]